MRRRKISYLVGVGLVSALVAFGQPGLAQDKPAGGDKPASNLAIIHEKLKADKKLIVSKYMELTESEAKKFWPVYDEYRSEEHTSELQSRFGISYAVFC